MALPKSIECDNSYKSWKETPEAPKTQYHIIEQWERLPTNDDVQPKYTEGGTRVVDGEYYGKWVNVTSRELAKHEIELAKINLEKLRLAEAKAVTEEKTIAKGRSTLDYPIGKHLQVKSLKVKAMRD